MALKLKIGEQLITDDASIPDLLSCELKYKVEKANGTIGYHGPKIPADLWYQITSFFKWTYDTAKSESQVRLFVSPTLKQWKAHAFPQEAKTGMTTRELDNQDAKDQRAQLELNPPDWFLFGTVHHHCSMNAFASGTDQDNERNQDGLHMTVGCMDKPNYTIHARLYRRGLQVDPDMSWFWDIGNILDGCPEVFREFIPKNYSDIFARKMMCIPVATEFPQLWKDNYIEIKPPEPVTTHLNGGGSDGFQHSTNIPCLNTPSTYSAESLPGWKRGQNAWKEIIYKAATKEITAPDLMDALADLKMETFPYRIIFDACRHHRLDLDDLERQMPLNLDSDMAEALLDAEFEAYHREKKEQAAQTNPPQAEGGEAETYSIT